MFLLLLNATKLLENNLSFQIKFKLFFNKVLFIFIMEWF